MATSGGNPTEYDDGWSDGYEEGSKVGGGAGSEPLGPPRGLVRSNLALAVVGAMIGITAFLVVADRPLAETALGALLAMAGSVGTFYFLNRQNQNGIK